MLHTPPAAPSSSCSPAASGSALASSPSKARASTWRPSSPSLSALRFFDVAAPASGIALPRPAPHLVVRFGPGAAVDVHAFGLREVVHRKTLHAGHRTVTARLALGACESVLGVPAAALSGRIVDLAALWGAPAAERLRERLSAADDDAAVAAVLDAAVAERAVRDRADRVGLAVAAAGALGGDRVDDVAADLGVSARHLRRVFHDVIGVSPKTFARLSRFRRALRAARATPPRRWADVAIDAGYCDQAHLIAEFRAIAGVTPRALLQELEAAHAIG